MRCINPRCENRQPFIASDTPDGPRYVRCGQCGAQGPKSSVEDAVAARCWSEPATDYRLRVPSEEDYDAAAADALEAWNDIAAAVRRGMQEVTA